MKGAGVRIVDLQTSTGDFLYRTPIKFGGTLVDRCTLLDVEVTVSDGARLARGFGSMPLGNVWSFPSRVLSYDETVGAMKALAERVAWITIACTESAHPIEINHLLEPEFLKAAEAVTADLRLAQPIPKLCALVVASPFDAAIHDAYGKIHGRHVYEC